MAVPRVIWRAMPDCSSVPPMNSPHLLHRSASRKLMLLLFVSAGAITCQSQFLSPVDTSRVKRDREIEASVADVSTSECTDSVYFQGGAVHYDKPSYRVNVRGKLTFTNRSKETVMLFKHPDPSLTERIAESEQDMASGKFIGGFNGDRMMIDHEPDEVSLDDFATLKPGDTFTVPIETLVVASPDMALHKSGKYFVQLGIDARPDAFYFNGRGERDFEKKWKTKARFVQFLLSAPFEMELKLDPSAEPCKE